MVEDTCFVIAAVGWDAYNVRCVCLTEAAARTAFDDLNRELIKDALERIEQKTVDTEWPTEEYKEQCINEERLYIEWIKNGKYPGDTMHEHRLTGVYNYHALVEKFPLLK